MSLQAPRPVAIRITVNRWNSHLPNYQPAIDRALKLAESMVKMLTEQYGSNAKFDYGPLPAFLRTTTGPEVLLIQIVVPKNIRTVERFLEYIRIRDEFKGTLPLLDSVDCPPTGGSSDLILAEAARGTPLLRIIELLKQQFNLNVDMLGLVASMTKLGCFNLWSKRRKFTITSRIPSVPKITAEPVKIQHPKETMRPRSDSKWGKLSSRRDAIIAFIERAKGNGGCTMADVLSWLKTEHSVDTTYGSLSVTFAKWRARGIQIPYLSE
ncbi:hypothetical protein HYT84_03375 [Candidatus Micrarchaeota archaeon]|nr:hypothetical protein [Candidatus Micrarchaeota archaeon]